MISKDMAQVWVNVPKPLKRRLAALTKVDHREFSESRVTIHDLRRSCASWLAISGENLAVIGRGVLHHTSLSHTGIYSRLNVTPVMRALEENSVRMLGG